MSIRETLLIVFLSSGTLKFVDDNDDENDEDGDELLL